MAEPSQDDRTEPQSDPTAKLRALAAGGNADALDAAWMAAVEDDSIGLGSLLSVLEDAAPRVKPKAMESLVWVLLSIRSERQGANAALDAAWRARDLLPDSDVLREELANLYRQVQAAAPGIETLVQMTILRKDLPLKAALPALERLLDLPPGTYVSDSRRKSPGRITGVDPARKVLAVSFGENDRAYDAVTVEALETLAPDDFRALAVFDKPQLAALAESDPAELVQRVLTLYGPRLGMKDLKARLIDVAVPAAGWSKWWAAARPTVKRCPVIDLSDGPQPEFFLRQKAITYEDTARDRFDSAGDVQEKLGIVLAYLGEAGHNPAAEADLLQGFGASLVVVASTKASPVDALASLAVVARIHRHLGDAAPPMPPIPPMLLANPFEVAAEIGTIRDPRVAQCTLALVREQLPAIWHDVYGASLPACDMEVCEWIADELAAAGRFDILTTAAATVLRQPFECVSALAWLWKAAAADKHPEAFRGLNRAQVTVRLFQAANEVGHPDFPDKTLRAEWLGQVRRTVSGREFAFLKDILDHTDAGWAKEIRTSVSRNSGLTDHLRIQVLEVIGHAHPVPVAPTVPPWLEENTVYSTAAALEARQKEFEHLVHVKMVENSTAIGEAAAQGDLSENAEFTAALEERDRMTERANAMQADIARAKTISRLMAESRTVNIGSRVEGRRLSTGQAETLTFLGPWDANTAKGIYYYRAPLAQAFMGKAVGDTVTLQTGTVQEQWEVLEIASAI